MTTSFKKYSSAKGSPLAPDREQWRALVNAAVHHKTWIISRVKLAAIRASMQ